MTKKGGKREKELVDAEYSAVIVRRRGRKRGQELQRPVTQIICPINKGKPHKTWKYKASPLAKRTKERLDMKRRYENSDNKENEKKIEFERDFGN